MFEMRIHHEGLKAFRVVKGATPLDVDMKVRAQMEIWDRKWARQQDAERLRSEKMNRWRSREQGKEEALSLSEDAGKRIAEVEALLRDGTHRGRFFSWETLKDKAPFPDPPPAPPKLQEIPKEPQEAEFAPTLSFLDRLLPPKKAGKLLRGRLNFEEAHNLWEQACTSLNAENARQMKLRLAALTEWELSKKKYQLSQQEQHAAVEAEKLAFAERNPSNVEAFFAEVLTRSEYPSTFPDEARLEYEKESWTLLVDYELPNITCLPSVKEVKYIATRDVLQEVPVSDTWLKKTYDEVLYQIALRTLHEIFIHDETEVVRSIVFNGWVRSIDKATGAEAHACIMSIHVQRQEFSSIRLDQVEPKACFRKLKGVASSKLIELTPIRPVISLSRDDERFVDPYAVLEGVDDRANLASMDWLDFENLIREVFEKEFSKNGGEVKITQASRDGGVDAIAFDPDPIRGGKIVIQAKRYTNVVGVAAVRDLYGTVHNEGATKGILVTTSTYGPDAYEFAKGKPLALLSGSELLYLLEQHGHKGKIDLAAARMELKQSQRQMAHASPKS